MTLKSLPPVESDEAADGSGGRTLVDHVLSIFELSVCLVAGSRRTGLGMSRIDKRDLVISRLESRGRRKARDVRIVRFSFCLASTDC